MKYIHFIMASNDTKTYICGCTKDESKIIVSYSRIITIVNGKLISNDRYIHEENNNIFCLPAFLGEQMNLIIRSHNHYTVGFENEDFD